jgi:hypothetical protein
VRVVRVRETDTVAAVGRVPAEEVGGGANGDGDSERSE